MLQWKKIFFFFPVRKNLHFFLFHTSLLHLGSSYSKIGFLVLGRHKTGHLCWPFPLCWCCYLLELFKLSWQANASWAVTMGASCCFLFDTVVQNTRANKAIWFGLLGLILSQGWWNFSKSWQVLNIEIAVWEIHTPYILKENRVRASSTRFPG